MFQPRTFALVACSILTVAAGCGGAEKAKGNGFVGGAGGGGGEPAGTSSGSGVTFTTSGSGAGATTSTSGSTAASTSSSAASSSNSSSGAPPSGGLHVQGNKLMDGTKTVRLFGIDHSGTESQCIQGAGIVDTGGAAVDQTWVESFLAWHVNSVRIPLNEDCWLDVNGPPSQYSGAAYQTAIAQYVNLLRQNGLYVILDLHWNNGGTNQSQGQQAMADLDHAPDFWTSVATAFKDDLGVVFDLYNEPHDIAWSCWMNGGCQAAGGFTVAGMNQLITAVRGTGAMNVVMAGGLNYAGDLSQWLANKPADATGNLAASFHTYNFSNCATQSCWTSQLAAVAAAVPLITGAMGENDCEMAVGAQPVGKDYINGYMAWADGAGVSYLGWAWNADFDHCSGPSLNDSGNWTGTSPTSPFGTDFKNHLLSVNP